MKTLVGQMAPEFNEKAVIDNQIVADFSLKNFLGQYVVLFFYPLDFTFVCPTELHAFQDYIEEFHKRQAQVVACSVDSCYSHLAWLNTPKEKGGINGISYPLIADLNKSIATSFGVLMEQEGIAYRGLFILDKKGVIRHQVVNDLPLGRSVDEVLRMLDAIIHAEQHGEVCPANWKKGSPSMTATRQGVEAFFAT
jgi:peroxiredoxin (alkyl hydroperoxide reductase subunit C)